MAGWFFRSVGVPGTSFNANVTPGQPAGIQLNDTLIIATGELLGADDRPVVPGWLDVTKAVNWTQGCAVYVALAAGNDPMPSIPSWGNQFQVAVCLCYGGGPNTLTGLVDAIHSSDRGYNRTQNLLFNPTGVPGFDGCLFLAINFTNTLGNGSPVATETGGLIGFTRRVTQWPATAKPTIVIDELIQPTAAAIASPGMTMNFTEASSQPGRSTILIFNPAIQTGTPPGENELPAKLSQNVRPSSLHQFYQVAIELLQLPPAQFPPGDYVAPDFILRPRTNIQLGIEDGVPEVLQGHDRVLTPVQWDYEWDKPTLPVALRSDCQGFDASDLDQVTNYPVYLEFNWTVPPGFRQWNRGFEFSINLNLLGKDNIPLGMFHNIQQDPPPRVRQPIANAGYEQKALSLFYTIPVKPPLCGEWPLPIRPRLPVQDYVEDIPLTLLSILTTMPPFQGSQALPPIRRQLPAALLSYDYSRTALLKGQDIVPFGTRNDQQNPRRTFRFIYTITERSAFLIPVAPPPPVGLGVRHVGRIVIPPGKLGEEIDVPFDFISGMTSPQELVVSATTTCKLYSGTDPNPELLIDGPASVSGTVAFQPIKPTIVGNIYDLTCTAVTNGGQTLILDAYYAIVPGLP